MTTIKPIAQMTTEEKATLLAHMLAKALDGSGVFPDVLGNRIKAFPSKPLRRRKPVTEKLAKA